MMDEIVNANWNYPTPIWFGLDRSSDCLLYTSDAADE